MRQDAFFSRLKLDQQQRSALAELELETYREFAPDVQAVVTAAFEDEQARYTGLLNALTGKIARMFGEAGQPPACKPGCCICCGGHPIYVQSYEVVQLVSAIECHPQRSRILARIVASTPTAGGGAVRTVCALLGSDGLCGVYSSRPVACASYLSFDLGSCEAYSRGERATADVPLFPYIPANVVYDFGIGILRKRLGVNADIFEINSVLKRVYSSARLLAACLDGHTDELSDLRVGSDE